MAKYGSQRAGGRKAGMWSTIGMAVQAGWGATARLLAVLVTIGLILVVASAAAGATETIPLLLNLFAVSR
jgi:hypothetical protein